MICVYAIFTANAIFIVRSVQCVFGRYTQAPICCQHKLIDEWLIYVTLATNVILIERSLQSVFIHYLHATICINTSWLIDWCLFYVIFTAEAIFVVRSVQYVFIRYTHAPISINISCLIDWLIGGCLCCVYSKGHIHNEKCSICIHSLYSCTNMDQYKLFDWLMVDLCYVGNN